MEKKIYSQWKEEVRSLGRGLSIYVLTTSTNAYGTVTIVKSQMKRIEGNVHLISSVTATLLLKQMYLVLILITPAKLCSFYVHEKWHT